MKNLIIIAMLILGVSIAKAQETNIDLNLDCVKQDADSAIILIEYSGEILCYEYCFKIVKGKVVNMPSINQGDYEICRQEIPDRQIKVSYILWNRRKEIGGESVKNILPGYEYLIEPVVEKKKINFHYYYWEIESSPKEKVLIHFD
jgi:hypothetical protein